MKKEYLRIPTCTYRLQFNRWFTFTQAREIVQYLVHARNKPCVTCHRISRPARRACTGHDITSHNKLNTAIGSRADYDAWVAQLQALRLA